jgi:biotin operon repressor
VQSSAEAINKFIAAAMKRFKAGERFDRSRVKEPTVQPTYSESDELENWANNIVEGTWAIPDTEEALDALEELMQKELPVGADAENASSALYSLIGDDELFDDLDELAEKDPEADARPVIKDWIVRNINHYSGMSSDLASRAMSIAKGTQSESEVTEGGVKNMYIDVEDGMSKEEFLKTYPGSGDTYDEIKKEIEDRMEEGAKGELGIRGDLEDELEDDEDYKANLEKEFAELMKAAGIKENDNTELMKKGIEDLKKKIDKPNTDKKDIDDLKAMLKKAGLPVTDSYDPELSAMANSMDKVERAYAEVVKADAEETEVGDYISRGMTKDQILKLIDMLEPQGYDKDFLLKDLAPMMEEELDESDNELEYNGKVHKSIDHTIEHDDPSFCYDCKLVSTTHGEIETENDENDVVCPRCGSQAFVEASPEEMDKYSSPEAWLDDPIDEAEIEEGSIKYMHSLKDKGMSDEEIAKELGMTADEVKQAMSKTESIELSPGISIKTDKPGIYKGTKTTSGVVGGNSGEAMQLANRVLDAIEEQDPSSSKEALALAKKFCDEMDCTGDAKKQVYKQLAKMGFIKEGYAGGDDVAHIESYLDYIDQLTQKMSDKKIAYEIQNAADDIRKALELDPTNVRTAFESLREEFDKDYGVLHSVEDTLLKLYNYESGDDAIDLLVDEATGILADLKARLEGDYASFDEEVSEDHKQYKDSQKLASQDGVEVFAFDHDNDTSQVEVYVDGKEVASGYIDVQSGDIVVDGTSYPDVKAVLDDYLKAFAEQKAFEERMFKLAGLK